MRRVISILLALVCQGLAFAAMYWLWMNFGGGAARSAMSVIFLTHPFADTIILQLQKNLVWIGTAAWGTGAVTTLVWLCIPFFQEFVDPRQVARLRRVWWSLSICGAVTAAGLGLLVTYTRSQ